MKNNSYSKSTYAQFVIENPHTSMDLKNYPHTHEIMFIVVTRYSPKSTYSPKFNETILTWSDKILKETIDQIMDGMMSGDDDETDLE